MGIWKFLKECYTIDLKGSWHVLRVLMWKHISEHKHCWASILWRVIQGCSVFLALLMFRLSLIPPTVDENVNQRDSYGVDKILFTPRNSMTETIMRDVKKTLNRVKLTSGNRQMEFDFYNKTTAWNDTNDSITVVDFKDVGLKTNNFSYSITTYHSKPIPQGNIRMREFFNDIQPSAPLISPILKWLQWAIDRSYIQLYETRRFLHEVRLYRRKKYIPEYLTALQSFIHLCTVIAPLPFFLFKSSRHSIAKRVGFQNLLRLSGISSNIYRLSHLLSTAITSSIYAVVIAFLLKVTQYPILPYSNPVIIYVTIVLYFIYIHCIAFVTSTISSDYHYTNSTAMLIYIGIFLIGFKWFTQDITSEIVRVGVCCILPHAPIFMFWDQVIYLESLGKGVTFSEISEWHSYHLPIIIIWLVLLMHVLCLMIVDWYLDLVIPSTFGITREWNFIFKKRFISRKKQKVVNFHVTAEQTVKVLRDSRYFEDLPNGAEIAVKILNLTKEYQGKPRIVALSKVCLDVCRGEVTVLLGNHYSGKSSLLCIISGMKSPSYGKVYVNGMDNVARLSTIKDIVSFCPQDIILYRHLTVRENIMFFEKLQKKKQKSIVDDLISQLELSEYEHVTRNQLPSGLLRCLQVACCIASGAEVLVFDEPTKNMGIEARHRVWDLIMKLRGQKTIIMSTTVLEEASALGDRIAILTKGKVRCFGSPSFLIDAIGIGLNLTITLEESTHIEDLHILVNNTIPDVKSQTHGARCVTFMLPQKESELFVSLIDALEEKKQEFYINSIDVGMSMEAVYAEFIDQFNDEDMVFESEHEADSMERNVRGWRLVGIQFALLTQRVYYYVWMKKYKFMFMQVVFPIIIIFLVTITTNSEYGYGKFIPLMRGGFDTLVFELEPFDSKRVALNNSSEGEEKNTTQPNNVTAKAPETKPFTITTKVLLPDNPYDLSRTLNMFSNLYIKLNIPKSNKTIATSLKAIERQQTVLKPKPVFLCIKWSVWVSFCTMLTLAPFILLSISERIKGTRDIHIMAGCAASVHWCSKLIAHLSIYAAIVPIAIIISALLLDLDKTFDNFEFVGVLLVILIAFALAFLTHLQFLSFLLHDYLAIGHIYFMTLGFGIIVPVIMLALDIDGTTNQKIRIFYFIVLSLVYFSPLYVFSMSLFYLVSQARLNAYCLLNRHLCPDLFVEDMYFSSTICCQSSSRTPFAYFDKLMCINITVLIIHSFLYLTIVILLQKRIIQYWIHRIVFRKYEDPLPKFYSKQVEMEKAKVRDRCLIKRFSEENLIVKSMTKTYYGFKKNKRYAIALQGITFLAKKGECIGILGPAGAGKSTLLRMLAGSVTMTRGDAWVTGYHIRSDRTKYLRKVGLVSSTGAIDGFYTGRENLTLICRLSGYPRRAAERLTTTILQDLGLNSYANTLVKKYTMSCWHRLMLCVVTVLDPAVAFIDEPMVDMDYATRAIIARSLEKLAAGGTTVIVTEAKLDWYQMETVFERIAILHKGQMASIGSAEDIVRELTTGYSVHIKIKIPKACWSSQSNFFKASESTEHAKEVQELKDDFQREFERSVIAEENVCMLFFYIRNEDHALSYNELFSKLHKLILKHGNVLESYTFNRTTLEEVFWRIPYLIDAL